MHILELFKLFGTIAVNNSEANQSIDETVDKAKRATGGIGTLSKEGEKSTGKLGKAFSKVGHVAAKAGKTIVTGLGVAGGAMGTLTVKAMNMAGELEQNMGGSEQVFKGYATKMQETAKEAFKNMGLSTSDFLGTANKMGALFQGAGFSIEESSNLASNAMQRAADVASIMGIDTTSAMEAIAGAAKGNFTMMDNLGVAMNDTTLQAYALEKGISKSTSEMTNQEKVGLAMEMFMEKTAYATRNYAKENATLAGSLGTAKAALTNFLDGSGSVDSLVDAFSNASKVIVKNLGKIAPRLISGLTDIVNQVIPMLSPLLQQLLPVIVEGAVSLINGLVSALPSIISALLSALPALIQGVEQIINALIQALPQIIQSLVSALPTLIPMLVDSLVSIIVMLCEMLPQIIQPITDYLPEIIISLVDALYSNYPTLIEGAIALVVALVQAFPQIILPLIEALPTILGSILKGLWKALPTLLKGIGSILGAVGSAIWTFIKGRITSLGKWFGGIWKSAKKMFSAIPTFFKEKFSQAWTGIKNVFSSVGSFFSGIWETIKSKFVQIGTKIGDAVGGAFKKAINAVLKTVENVVNTPIKAINGLIGIINKIPGVNLGQLKTFNLPRLEKGGILPKGKIGLLEGNGAEAVVPLEKNLEWTKNVAKQISDFTSKNNVSSVKEKSKDKNETINITIHIDSFVNQRAEDLKELVDNLSEMLATQFRRKAESF